MEGLLNQRRKVIYKHLLKYSHLLGHLTMHGFLVHFFFQTKAYVFCILRPSFLIGSTRNCLKTLVRNDLVQTNLPLDTCFSLIYFQFLQGKWRTGFKEVWLWLTA
jgi:hypothetical protein